LNKRGIILAVCSKNDDAVARSGFAHPDSVLKLADISAFRANWDPKHENILQLAQELNVGVDSMVFIDDNPAERAIVQAQLPGVAVPDVGNNPAYYQQLIQSGRFFETVSLSGDDLKRSAQYADNAKRTSAMATFSSYGEYLDSLEMVAEIASFRPVYLDRITQLTNKTNQFNLTTRRYTLAEIESAAMNPECIGLYGRLADRFGDNGLVSVVLGRKDGNQLHLDLWLMSCRVLKRDMELAMLDELVESSLGKNISAIVGYYIPTKKNSMVSNFYQDMGFELKLEETDGTRVYSLQVAGYTTRNHHIKLETRTA
jgi:FkbH-like protein